MPFYKGDPEELELEEATYDFEFELVTPNPALTEISEPNDLSFPLFSSGVQLVDLKEPEEEKNTFERKIEYDSEEELELYEMCQSVSVSIADIMKEAEAYTKRSGPIINTSISTKRHPKRLSKFCRRRIREAHIKKALERELKRKSGSMRGSRGGRGHFRGSSRGAHAQVRHQMARPWRGR
jgi:hypothetical protein